MTAKWIRRLSVVAFALVTIALAAPACAAGSAELLRCQKAIHTRVTALVKLLQTSLTNCAYRVETCELTYEIDGEDPTQCVGGVAGSCAGYHAKITATKAAAVQKALAVCLAIPPAELVQSVAGLGLGAAAVACPTDSVADLVPCIFDHAQCAAERTVFALDPRAAAALDVVALASSYPCVAP